MARLPFRKLRRWTVATIAIASLVLCLATVGLWVRSYSKWDFERAVISGRKGPVFLTRIGSNCGAMELMRTEYPPYTSLSGVTWGTTRYSTGAIAVPRIVFRFHWFAGPNFSPTPLQRQIVFPHWSLALLFAIVPGWWFAAIVRSRRRPHAGCCANCGYDLRASPGRCPECGIFAKEDGSS